MLVVVANNSSFMNDEIHQQRVAARRGRPVENAHVGVRIDDPQPDLVAHVGGLGVSTFGPVTAAEQLIPVLTDAVRAATTGPALVDVQVARAAYTVGE
jgi:thiamine pyrophosphate-dependent acetolactate synthase large subunit-like protein